MEREQVDVTFGTSSGLRLAAILDRPVAEPRGYAVFAHCFTCTKDYLAPARIARGLAERGIAVLRFDFTGLGESCGDFGETSFSTNIADVEAACTYLRDHHGQPRLLMGHSLGGAAVLAAAPLVEGVRAVVTLAAPSKPGRLQRLFEPVVDELRQRGSAEVVVGGRPFRIGRAFVDDLESYSVQEVAGRLGAALLVLHSPTDEVVHIDSAREIFQAARHPKSFLSLDGVDHLLSSRQDAQWVTSIIHAWGSRYLEPGR